MASTEYALQQSIEGLYTDHYGWLKAWLRRRLDNSFDAADLAHDTFFRLLVRQEAKEALRHAGGQPAAAGGSAGRLAAAW